MKELELNGVWSFSFLRSRCLEEVDPAAERTEEVMCVPGCFDALPQYYCQRGCGVYSRTFTLEEDWAGVWLRIDGMGLRGRFFLDGRLLGTWCLPYSTFELACGALSAGSHRLTVLVDNMFDADRMKLFLPYYDFYAFGGFYHGVALRLSHEVNALDRVLIRTLDFGTGKLEARFLFKGEVPGEFRVFLAVDGEPEKEFAVKGGRLVLERPDLALWSPESPALHTLRARMGNEGVTETFGIREVTTHGREILLNGSPLRLRGFNRHESHPATGAATTFAEMLTDLQHLKTLNANCIRGCHYPQSQAFLDLCDRMGFLVWEESLGWGNTDEEMRDNEFIRQQIEQTRLMVRNSFNHPSVIVFAFLNENFSHTDPGVDLCRRLAETVRAEDSGRLVTFANCRNFEDRALEYMDVLTFNAYPGWISDDDSRLDPLEEISPELEKILARLRRLPGGEKPIVASEMGCCAIYGSHDEAAAQWTEEFQAGYLARVIDAVNALPEISGLLLWQLNDAKSYHRKGANIRCKPLSQNLAGVYDAYRRPKLAAAVVREKFREL